MMTDKGDTSSKDGAAPDKALLTGRGEQKAGAEYGEASAKIEAALAQADRLRRDLARERTARRDLEGQLERERKVRKEVETQIVALAEQVGGLRSVDSELDHATRNLTTLVLSRGWRIGKLLQFVNAQVLGSGSRGRARALADVLSRLLRRSALEPYDALANTGLDIEHWRGKLRQTLDGVERGLGSVRDAAAAAAAMSSGDDRTLVGVSQGTRDIVSIVLPVYNQADLLPQAIDGIIDQTYRDWELIIVNDGSSDDVARAVEPFLHDPRIRELAQPHQGLPSALNNGFTHARGEFLTWTSADNIMLPKQIETLLGALRDNLDAGLAYSDYEAIDDAGRPLADPSFRPHNRPDLASSIIRLPSEATLANFHVSGDNFIGPSFMYRADVAAVVGCFDENAFGAEDYDYWLRTHLVTRFVHVAEPLYRYRVHDNTVSARVWKLDLVQNIRMMLDVERERRSVSLKREELHKVVQTFWRGPDQYSQNSSGSAQIVRPMMPVEDVAAIAETKIRILALDHPLPRLFDVEMLAHVDIVVTPEPTTHRWIRQQALPANLRVLCSSDDAIEIALRHAIALARFERTLAARGHHVASKPRAKAPHLLTAHVQHE